jgi:hypothetical protein
MKTIIYKCDKCQKEQDYSMEEVDICSGFKTHRDSVELVPFQSPIRGKAHLCEKCFGEWCRSTCLFIYPNTLKEIGNRKGEQMKELQSHINFIILDEKKNLIHEHKCKYCQKRAQYYKYENGDYVCKEHLFKR